MIPVPHQPALSITSASFGQLSTGQEATLFTLTNALATTVTITNFGAIVVSLTTKDAQGELADVVLGYDNIAAYEQDPYYLGAVIGRYAGRIARGELTIEGVRYQLHLNAVDSQLHGGDQALNKQLWQASTEQTEKSVCLILQHTSPDTDNGFPGEVAFCVKYTLTNTNELQVEYFAQTNKPTIVNLTQHSYFNLAGHDQGKVYQHQLTINADHFLPMTKNAYPTGGISPVVTTPFDFTQAKAIGDDISSSDEQLIIGKGYDNYWLLNESAINQQAFAAQVVEPKSGRRLTIYSDQPSLIFYSGNYLDGSQKGKNGYYYQAHDALCLETQRAVDHSIAAEFSNVNRVLLRPEAPFYSKTRFVFDHVNIVDEY